MNQINNYLKNIYTKIYFHTLIFWNKMYLIFSKSSILIDKIFFAIITISVLAMVFIIVHDSHEVRKIENTMVQRRAVRDAQYLFMQQQDENENKHIENMEKRLLFLEGKDSIHP